MNFRNLFGTIIFVLFAQSAYAASEWVYVDKVMEDTAIVVRKNGDAYQIEKGVGCISLGRFEGRSVLITSPGLFLGIGSEMIIPDVEQKCRIWENSLVSIEE